MLLALPAGLTYSRTASDLLIQGIGIAPVNAPVELLLRLSDSQRRQQQTVTNECRGDDATQRTDTHKIIPPNRAILVARGAE